MSTEDRTEIADAVKTVPAVKSCSPHYRTLSKAGDACVRLAKMTPDENGFPEFVTTWRVYIALPQDNVKAEQWFDANHALIAQALADVWVPGTVTPAALVFDAAATPINGVIYEGTR